MSATAFDIAPGFEGGLNSIVIFRTGSFGTVLAGPYTGTSGPSNVVMAAGERCDRDGTAKIMAPAAL